MDGGRFGFQDIVKEIAASNKTSLPGGNRPGGQLGQTGIECCCKNFGGSIGKSEWPCAVGGSCDPMGVTLQIALGEEDHVRLVEVFRETSPVEEFLISQMEAIDKTRVGPDPCTIRNPVGARSTISASFSQGDEVGAPDSPVDVVGGSDDMHQQLALCKFAARLGSEDLSPVGAEELRGMTGGCRGHSVGVEDGEGRRAPPSRGPSCSSPSESLPLADLPPLGDGTVSFELVPHILEVCAAQLCDVVV
jgi:hypothetical protein